MASPIGYNNRLWTFGDFMVSESVRLKKTEFGVNSFIDDRNFKRIDTLKASITFIEYQDSLYLIFLDDNNEFGFGTLKDNHKYVTDTDVNIDKIIIDITDDNLNVGAPAIKIFSKIMYVMAEMVKIFNLEDFYFSSANDKLSPVYDKLVMNKYFLSDLSDKDISFINKKDNEYYFKHKG